MGGIGMIWLTWRQHRKQLLFTGIGLAVLAALMVPTGLAMRNAFADRGLDDCVRDGVRIDPGRACDAAFQSFGNEFGPLAIVGVLFVVLPLLVGLFFGAPLVAREVEHGTHRLVWTQGVGRRHWAVVKFGMVAAAALGVATVYGLGMSWWMSPLRLAGNFSSRLSPLLFDMQGVVPIGYTLFAVALGIVAGTVWPKVLPAMAATLAGYAVLRIALTLAARPHYLPARERTYPVERVGTATPAVELDNWVLARGVRDADGRMVAPGAEIACVSDGAAPGGGGCGAGPGAYNWQLYHPGSRFWPFQWIETGIFAALAVLLLYLAIRRVRRIA
jgi:hypothetical protein